MVRHGADERRLLVGPAALERGLLLGRDARCDVVFGSDRVSRVHCLLFENPWTRELCVADAGSSNGTYVDGCEVRCASLQSGALVQLAAGTTTVRWESNASAVG